MSEITPEVQATLVAEVRWKAEELTKAVTLAESSGVSPAVLLPELFQVFSEAGMMPEGIDFGSILGMFN